MRLMIGLGALESRQERMMDVDAAPRQFRGEVVRQHLHVASEHDQIGSGRLHQPPYFGFLRRLGFARHRHVMERNVAELVMRIGFARMVGNDARDFHAQFADPPAIEDIGEAMVELGNQQHHLGPRRARDDFVFHVELGREIFHRVTELVDRRVRLRRVERHAHIEAVRFDGVELVRFPDIETAFEQSGRHGGDDARTVRASQRQQIMFAHFRP